MVTVLEGQICFTTLKYGGIEAQISDNAPFEGLFGQCA